MTWQIKEQVYLLIFQFEDKFVNDQRPFVELLSGIVSYLRTLFLQNFLLRFCEIVFTVQKNGVENPDVGPNSGKNTDRKILKKWLATRVERKKEQEL